MADADDENPAAPFLWILLILVTFITFWGQAVITEERFVPSLNVIANRLGIPDDVAGATLMAAGASSPELFASFVSLFVTHSALGFGTIVGSEIFNQLAISAGSILAARNAKLYLNRAVLLREIFFYGLALVCLQIAMSDRRVLQDEDGNDETYVFISWDKGLVLVIGYVAYVMVCAYYDRILSIMVRITGYKAGERTVDESPLPASAVEMDKRSLSVVDLPFLRQIRREPRPNFHRASNDMEVTIEMLRSHSLVSGPSEASIGHMASSLDAPPYGSPSRSQDSSPGRTSSRSGFYSYLVDPIQPDQLDIHGLEDIDRDEVSGTLSCFLWQQSSFCNKARVDIRAWRLRWFTFRHNGITSVPDRGYRPKVFRYPDFQRIEVDEAHLLFRCSSRKRNFTFMAPTSEILQAVLDACNQSGGTGTADTVMSGSAELEANVEAGPSLIEFPHGGSRLEQAAHVFLFPFKLVFHYTIPDSRRDVAERIDRRVSDASLALIACVIWIVILSTAMVTSLERIGELLHVSPAVIGVTASAVGTSLPNYVASQVAARQGFGNMAISNAFGSNTFNIFVGLGVPWTLKTTFGGEYSDLRDDGIAESVLLLAAALVGYLGLVVCSNFVLYRWHAYLFYLMYVLYLVYAIGQVYI